MSTQSLSDSPDFNTLQISPNMINVRQTLQNSQVGKIPDIEIPAFS